MAVVRSILSRESTSSKSSMRVVPARRGWKLQSCEHHAPTDSSPIREARAYQIIASRSGIFDEVNWRGMRGLLSIDLVAQQWVSVFSEVNNELD